MALRKWALGLIVLYFKLRLTETKDEPIFRLASRESPPTRQGIGKAGASGGDLSLFQREPTVFPLVIPLGKISIPLIGIGGDHYRSRPCHTTRHAGPHRAVREVEVMRAEPPEVDRSRRRSARFSAAGHCYATSSANSPPPAAPHSPTRQALSIRDTWWCRVYNA